LRHYAFFDPDSPFFQPLGGKAPNKSLLAFLFYGSNYAGDGSLLALRHARAFPASPIKRILLIIR
jgi:hypothetical protein